MKNLFLSLSLFVIYFFSSFTAQAQPCDSLGLDQIVVLPIAGDNGWATLSSQISGWQVSANKSGVITKIGIIRGSNTTYKVALYSDENNTPEGLIFSSGSIVGTPIAAGTVDTFYVDIPSTPINFGEKIWPSVKWSTTGIRRLLDPPSAEGLSFQYGNGFNNAFPADLGSLPIIMQSGIYGIFLVIEDCVDPIPGCIDPTACNFNLEAQVDDFSCYYSGGVGCMAGDFNNNGVIDTGDLQMSLNTYGYSVDDWTGGCATSPFDLNGDGLINQADQNIFLTCFGY